MALLNSAILRSATRPLPTKHIMAAATRHYSSSTQAISNAQILNKSLFASSGANAFTLQARSLGSNNNNNNTNANSSTKSINFMAGGIGNARNFASSQPPPGPENDEIDPEKEKLKQTENNMEKLIDYGSRAAVVGLTTAVLASAEPENPTTYAIALALCVCGLRLNAWGLAAVATVLIFGIPSSADPPTDEKEPRSVIRNWKIPYQGPNSEIGPRAIPHLGSEIPATSIANVWL
eukprot:CAMPEP_0206461990 /NCGR_PEP_ID=MMETSP0324_2-20121206/25701_1 /ASSEMBLY_ACC=CAM_ASM_000836 /TAXON_ID=2866 /ORGANISM="Crypthecodinium cohnii, Strain Seligo" /LENGTH=234 /DNA_ID=CAMNT_0053934039 /DNA_START=48 /DNA_END=753 /DNA_ORIENTATION=-